MLGLTLRMLLKRSHLSVERFLFGSGGFPPAQEVEESEARKKPDNSWIAGLEFIFHVTSRAGAMNISIHWAGIDCFHQGRYPEDARVDSIQGHV